MEFKRFTSLENTYRQNIIDKIIHEGLDEGLWVALEKIHGCFEFDQKVTLADGTYKPIGEIVEQKYSGEVLGIDKEGNLVPTKVVNWYNNGEGKDWVKVSFQTYGGKGGRTRVITCTPEHKFLVNGEYSPIGDAKVGDEVQFSYNGISLDFIQKQILIGKLLGDGSLSNNSIHFGHKKDKEEYLDYTLKCLGSLAGNKQKECMSGYGTTMTRARTISSQSIADFFKEWEQGKDYVPEIELTPISLAFWYMDDGSISLNEDQRPRASFATCSLSRESCERLVFSLSKLGIRSSANTESKGYTRISITADSTELLFAMISPFVPVCMQYKLTPEFRLKDGGAGLVASNELRNKMEKSYAKIKKIEKITQTKTRYDIETGTHNYFVNNIHVHNCNASFWYDGVELRFASRSQFVDGTFYGCQEVIDRYSNTIKEGYKALGLDGKVLTIYGELYGDGIQKEVKYGPKDFRSFGVEIDGVPQNFDYLVLTSLACRISLAPIMETGTFKEMTALSRDFRSKLTPEGYEGENQAEGLAIQPLVPKWFQNGNRVWLKNKTEAFSEVKERTPKTVVELPEDMSILLNTILAYANEARVNNVVSKLGAVTNKDFGKILGLTLQDMFEDYNKDHDVEFKTASGDHYQRLLKLINSDLSAIVRGVFVRALEE